MGHKFLVFTMLLVAAPVVAQRHHHEEHEGKHEAAFFLGATIEEEEGERENLFTFGVEYEYRFLPRLGISAEIEHIDGADTQVFAFPAVFHAYRGLMFIAGPGWENAPRRRERFGDETRFLIRTGVQYSIHLGGRFAVMPALDFDFVREGEPIVALPEAEERGWRTVYVVGVKLAVGF